MNPSMIPYINTLGRFCGVRDVPVLSQHALYEKYGFPTADLMVLFGGSILCGGDVLAVAMKENVAKCYMIVGGVGHTTQALRDRVQAAFPGWNTAGLPEAELLNGCLKRKYGLSADLLECRSTNCGNNITFLLELLKKQHMNIHSCILMQDASMQRRMAAVMRKARPDMTIINYASYNVQVVEQNGQPAFESTPSGMWSMERYVTLLMGEIPRLVDDENGYGPNGRGYLAHEDVPDSVIHAYQMLKQYDPALVRTANAAYAKPR
ncbi:MAG: YdcF family protein [Oscillospiraceae bacterium]|jgi:hypothetical protein|nr:YdcF family protein [Oscillospiraceae bacterium]